MGNMIKLRIKAANEHEFRRVLVRLAAPFLADLADVDLPDDGDDAAAPIDLPAGQTPTGIGEDMPIPQAAAKKPTGRPKGSTNKKSNGSGVQTEPTEATAAIQSAEQSWLPLAQQVQLITEAVRVDRAKFSPLLPGLRKEIGVDLIAKAEEKHRPVLQAFIDAHGLAV